MFFVFSISKDIAILGNGLLLRLVTGNALTIFIALY